jgi:hypothetical protein
MMVAEKKVLARKPAPERRLYLFLLLIAVSLVLIAVGVWQGDFSEIAMNGATL